MPIKKRKNEVVTLRSRGGEKIYVTDMNDRAFLEQADKLVVELNERLEDSATVEAARRSPASVKRINLGNEKVLQDLIVRSLNIRGIQKGS